MAIPQNSWHTAGPPHEPPNYRKATKKGECCATCEMFDRGQCWGYGNTDVEQDAVCDSWEKDPKRKTADLFGDSRPGETPQRQEDWEATTPNGVPWPDIDPAMWYKIRGEDVDMAPLPFKGAQPVYVHQGTAYVGDQHPGLVEWAGDSGLKLSYTPLRLPNSPMQVFQMRQERAPAYQDFPGRYPLVYNPERNAVFLGTQGAHHLDIEDELYAKHPEWLSNSMEYGVVDTDGRFTPYWDPRSEFRQRNPLELRQIEQGLQRHIPNTYLDPSWDRILYFNYEHPEDQRMSYTPMRLPNALPVVYRTKHQRPPEYSDHRHDAAVFYNRDRDTLFVSPEGSHHFDIIKEVPYRFLGDEPLRGYLSHYENGVQQLKPSSQWTEDEVNRSLQALKAHYPNVQLGYPESLEESSPDTPPTPRLPSRGWQVVEEGQPSTLEQWFNAGNTGLTRQAEYPGGGQFEDMIKRQEDYETYNRGDTGFQPEETNPDVEPRGPFGCSQCDYKPTSLADYRMHVEYEHNPHEEEIQDGHFPQVDDFDEPLPLRRMQPKPNSGETIAGLHVLRLPDDRACYSIPQFETYSKLAGFETPTTVYYGAFDDGELVGYGVVREDDEPEVMMVQAKEHGRGVGTAILRRIKRDYSRFYTHADSLGGERLMRREGIVNVKGHLWRYAQGKDPKDMLEAGVPFVYDIGKDTLTLGYPGYSTHDVTSPAGFTPGGIVEGTYEPGGKVTVWSATTHPWTVRHLLDLWKAQAPQMEVTSVEAKELDGSLTKLAGMETQSIGPYMNALVQSSPAAANAYRALSAAGGEVYVVGGAVRDYMRGVTPKDTDMLVRGLQPEEVLHVLRKLPGGVKLTGQRFGVYRYWSSRQGDDEVEIALPRTDRYEGGSRAKAEITVDPELPIENDLERRDFTANAMAVRLDDGKLFDPYNGAHDVQRGVLRTTHPNSFKEDPSRLVRALIAHGRFGLYPDERTRLEMQKYGHMLTHESPDTLNKVLDKWMESPNPAQGVRLAHDTGMLKYLFPEVEDHWDFDQRNPYHNLPLGEHLVHTLDNVSRLTSDPDVRIAALLHDIGKPASQWIDKNGVGHYYRVDTKDPQTGEVVDSKGQYHESVGSKMADSLMRRRFNWPRDRTTRIAELVRRHMFPPFSDDVGARKFMNKHNEYADDLLHLREADQAGKGLSPEEIAARTQVNDMRGLVEQQREMGAPVQQAAMAVNGNDILGLGLKPGPAVGQVLQTLTNAVVENPELNTRDQLLQMAQQQIDALPLETRATASVKVSDYLVTQDPTYGFGYQPMGEEPIEQPLNPPQPPRTATTLPKSKIPISQMTPEQLAEYKAAQEYARIGSLKWLADNPRSPENIVNHWHQTTPEHRAQGMSWYQDAHNAARQIAQDRGITVAQAAGLIANYSPQQHWATNLEMASRAAAGETIGGPKQPGQRGFMASRSQADAAARILSGEDYRNVFRGKKITSFGHLIEHGQDTDPTNPAVVIDRHALGVAHGGYADDGVYTHSKVSAGVRKDGSSPVYDEVANMYRQAADLLNANGGYNGVPIQPHQLQAATWLTRQRLNAEGGYSDSSPAVANRTRKVAEASVASWNAYANEYHPTLVDKTPGTGFSAQTGAGWQNASDIA